MEISVGYKTSSGNTLQMDFDIQTFKREEVPYLPYEEIGEMCGNCRGWNGGCPGCSPWYPRIKPKMRYMTSILLTVDMAWACMYSRGGKSIVSSNYFRMGYTDRLTDKFLWSVLKKVRNNKENFVLGCGHCPRCPKKRCGPITGEKCQKPLERMFSMEATGIDCDSFVRLMTGNRLLWWYKEEVLPVRMQRLSGVINDSPEATVEVIVQAIHMHRHILPLDDIVFPEKPKLTVVEASHNGVKYPAYSELKNEYRDA